MSRFDPKPDEPYGTCKCGETVATRDAMSAHFKAVADANGGRAGGSAHSVRITNQTREERIESELENIVESAVRDIMDELDRLIDKGDITEDEATEATKSVDIDLFDQWKEYVSK